jgi:hypothetical protein
MTSNTVPVTVTSPRSLGGKPPMRDLREVVRDEHVMRPKILAAVADGPLSPPQIAAAIGQPENEVVFWIMGMRKYGYLVEVEADEDEDEGYFLYRAARTEGQSS